MPLVTGKKVADSRSITYDNEIAARIQQRRYQVLVHSLLYYDLDVNLVSDYKWQDWAQELVTLQNDNPEIAEQVIFADAFRGFDASTGMGLPYTDGQIIRIAARLLQSSKDSGSGDALEKLKTQVPAQPEEWERYKKKKHTIEETKPKEEKPKQEVKKVETGKVRKGLFSVPRK